MAASEKAKKDFNDLEKATGISLTDSASGGSKNTLSGAITSITAEQADLLAGQFGGLRVAQLQTNTLLMPVSKGIGDLSLAAQRNFEVALQTAANTLRTANNTDALADMRTALVSMDKKIGSSNAALIAAGRVG
jgi:hypothetical protein